MDRNEVFKAWVPTGGSWSLWARPVLFAQMDEKVIADAEPISEDLLYGIELPRYKEDTAWIIDLPGEESVRFGLVAAPMGYRPVPLFNGCTGKHEAIDQSGILKVLASGAALMVRYSNDDGLPAFLLDSMRMTAERLRPGDFDNRWRVFVQDFPSPELLKERGINRVLLIRKRRPEPAFDLAGVLVAWQAAGIQIEVCLVENSPTLKPFVGSVPWWRRSPFRALLQMLGLNRGPRNGFGRIVPEPRHG